VCLLTFAVFRGKRNIGRAFADDKVTIETERQGDVMSKRIDVTGKNGVTLSAKGSGLIYTKELGWLDLGHARGTDIRLLLNQFRSGEDDAYCVTV